MSRTRWNLSLIAGALVVCVSLPSIAAASSRTEQDPFVFALWLQSSITTLSFLDIVAVDPLTIEAQIMEGLMGFEPAGDNEPTLILAESVTKIDPATYVFRLRRGVLFHPPPAGHPPYERELTAADVKFSIEQAQASRNLIAGPLRNIDVLAPAKYLVKIKLQNPVDDVLRVIASSTAHVTSKAYYESLGTDSASRQAAFARHPIGTGPYRLVSPLGESGSRNVVLERYADYRDPSWGEAQDRVERVEFRVFENLDEIELARRAGEVDAATVPLIDCAQEVPANPAGSSVTLLEPPFLSILAINTSRGSLSDPRVRRLLNAAVDGEAIRQICPPRPTTWRGIHYFLEIPELYLERKVEDDFDRLLAEPGMRERVAELKAEGLVLLAAETYDVVSDDIVVSVKEALEARLKIEVEIDRKARLAEEISEGNYDLVYVEVVPDLPTLSGAKSHTDLARYITAIPRELFFSHSPSNLARYDNPKVDRLLDEIQYVFDDASARRIHRKVQKLLLEDAPFIWLPTVRHTMIVLGSGYDAPWAGRELPSSVQFLNSSFLQDVRRLSHRNARP